MSCTFSYITHANIAWASTYWTKLKTIPFITIKSMLHVLLSMKINWHTIIFPMLNWNNFPLKIGYLIFQKLKKKRRKKEKRNSERESKSLWRISPVYYGIELSKVAINCFSHLNDLQGYLELISKYKSQKVCCFSLEEVSFLWSFYLIQFHREITLQLMLYKRNPLQRQIRPNCMLNKGMGLAGRVPNLNQWNPIMLK